ncbi:MAG: isopenicillin N synthase family oxygenase [Alphaproteobacteria bacterium]|nr:isopenicillin N synthase family oxygenase [Alphaproteobacteria bacterium]
MPADPVRQADPSEIPVIDLSPLIDGDDAARARVSEQIVDAAENNGFFYVVNHGVPAELVDGLFDVAARFFDTAESEKLKLGLANSTCFRGYLPLDSRGSDPTKRNFLEAFQIGEEHDAEDDYERMMYGPNQWPDAPADLADTMMAYHRAMRELSDRLQAAFAVGIDLPEDYFLKYYRKPLNQLRLLHYPPPPEDLDEGVMGARVHTDTGAFTILLQDQNGGLEVQTQSGEWVAATPLEGAFVVNVGDMLENWTNGRFISVKHRVVNRSGNERYSVPYFLNPDLDAVVEPLPEFTGPDNPPKFEPVHVGEFLTHRFDSIWPRKAA